VVERPGGGGNRFEDVVLDAIEQAVIAADRDGRFRVWNRAAETLTGVRADEVLGRSVDEVSAALGASSGLQRLIGSLGGGSSRVVAVRRRDGTTYQTRVHDSTVMDGDEQVGVVRVAEDVSAMVTAQRRLRRSEERFRTIFEDAPLGIAIADRRGRIVQCNRSYRDLLGYSAAELRGRDMMTLVHPEDRAANQSALERLRRGEIGFFQLENRCVRRDGRVVWIDKYVTVLADAAGEHLLALASDVSERHRLDSLVRRSEAQLRAILDHAPAGIAKVALDGGFREVNPMLCRITGRGAEQLLALRFHDLSHPEDLEEDVANVASLLAGKRRGYRMQKRILRPDGAPVWIELSVSLVHDDRGTPDHFIAVVEDISGRRDAEESLRREAATHVYRTALNDALHPPMEPRAAVQAVLELLAGHLDASGALWAQLDPSGEISAVIDSSSRRNVSQREGFLRWVLTRLSPDDTMVATGDEDPPPPELSQGTAAHVTVPLGGSAGLSSVLSIRHDRPRRWSRDEVALIEETALRLWLALERERAAMALRRRQRAERRARERAELMADVTSRVVATTSPADHAQRIVDVLVPRFADEATVEELGDDAQLRAGATRADRATNPRSSLPGPRGRLAVPLHLGGGRRGSMTVTRTDADREPFDRDDLDFLRTLADRAGLAFERLYVHERELRTARRLQQALLPDRLASGDGVEVAGTYSAAEDQLDVGGDWYECIELEDGRLLAVVGDVVGHGLDAAVIMGRLRAGLLALSSQVDEPGELLVALDRFARGPNGGDFATVCCAVLDPLDGSVRYASAGHPPPLVVESDGGCRWLEEARSVPLCTFPTPHRPTASTHLEPGSLLLLYSDGLIERRGLPITEGMRRLERAAVGLRGTPTASLGAGLVDSLAGESHDDDAVVLVLRFQPTAAPVFRRSFPARPEEFLPLRTDVRAWLDELGAPHAAKRSALLALGEACANAVEHAYADAAPGVVEVELSASASGLAVRVRDHGSWKAEPRSAEPLGRGYGLHIMRTLSEEFEQVSGGDGTVVTMRLPLHARSGG
jgi:PAS domain S-box-containing protein